MAREYVMFRVQKENVRRRRCDQSSERKWQENSLCSVFRKKMAREYVMFSVQKENGRRRRCDQSSERKWQVKTLN